MLPFFSKSALSFEAIEYTDCISAEGVPTISVLDMTVNNQMMKLQ